jgi:hypothetical protein
MFSFTKQHKQQIKGHHRLLQQVPYVEHKIARWTNQIVARRRQSDRGPADDIYMLSDGHRQSRGVLAYKRLAGRCRKRENAEKRQDVAERFQKNGSHEEKTTHR